MRWVFPVPPGPVTNRFSPSENRSRASCCSLDNVRASGSREITISFLDWSSLFSSVSFSIGRATGSTYSNFFNDSLNFCGTLPIEIFLVVLSTLGTTNSGICISLRENTVESSIILYHQYKKILL